MDGHDNLLSLRNLKRQVEHQLLAAAGFGQRLRELRREREMTLDRLSELTGISKSYLSQVENNLVSPPRDDKVAKLEVALAQPPGSLRELAHLAQAPEDVRHRLEQLSAAFNRSQEFMELLLKQIDQRRPAPAAELDNTAGPQPIGRLMPVINSVAAGSPREFTDLGYPVGMADEFIPSLPGLNDPNAFAVRICGHSMEPRYQDGDLVLISPAAAVHSGDDCYARFAPECGTAQGATFKRAFFEAAGQIRLQPLNADYPALLLPAQEVAGLYKAIARYERL